MDLTQTRGHTDGETQEASHRHGLAEQATKRLAAGILQHEHDLAKVLDELQRPHGPRTVQFVLQSIFVSETLEDGGGRMLRDGPHRQHGTAIAVRARAPSSAEDTITVLPQDLEPVIFLSAEARSWFQLQASAIMPSGPLSG
jgi:hypothetical protein